MTWARSGRSGMVTEGEEGRSMKGGGKVRSKSQKTGNVSVKTEGRKGARKDEESEGRDEC